MTEDDREVLVWLAHEALHENSGFGGYENGEGAEVTARISLPDPEGLGPNAQFEVALECRNACLDEASDLETREVFVSFDQAEDRATISSEGQGALDDLVDVMVSHLPEDLKQEEGYTPAGVMLQIEEGPLGDWRDAHGRVFLAPSGQQPGTMHRRSLVRFSIPPDAYKEPVDRLFDAFLGASNPRVRDRYPDASERPLRPGYLNLRAKTLRDPEMLVLVERRPTIEGALKEESVRVPIPEAVRFGFQAAISHDAATREVSCPSAPLDRPRPRL
ncbi:MULTISPECIES: hypothetical protein [unclassified Thioalkalivibrio]|uniref:hypothetical protein n=1 Tax=unclassified Thioalkalivibrio TaxID=2621013 RepID=UPI001E5113D8|nr:MULTISPECIES: hypothetical protein [unclassified Thioalkalivibrio]